MPAAITTDWPAVKATAIARNSIKEAADLHGVTYESARVRACREEWPVGRRPAKMVQQAKDAEQAQLVKVSPQAVTSVTSTADALATALADDSRATRAALATAARKAGEAFARKDGEEVIELAKPFQQITSAAGMIGGWGDKGQDQGADMLILSIGGNVNLGGQHLHGEKGEE